jgi:hypothetical protein
MKAKEIETLLKNGSKLIEQNNAYFDDMYFINSETPENRITSTQFEKYKALCQNKDDSDKYNKGLKGQRYRIYYWL